MKQPKSLVIYILIIILLALATFVGKGFGNDFAISFIYRSWWFIGLWILLLTFAFYDFRRYIFIKRWRPSVLLHASLVIILMGALVTHLTSLSGTIHLRENLQTKVFMDDNGEEFHSLPFAVILNNFCVNKYPGTEAPMNYVSKLTIIDNNIKTNLDISMNRILNYHGYRFLQSSFDEDQKGSYLSVQHDPYGIFITYSGYFLFAISMIWMLCSKEGLFRKLLRNPLLKKLSFFFVLLFVFNHAKASDLPVLPVDVANKLGRTQVLYNDRIVPLQTMAKDFTLKLSGSLSYKGYTAEQVLTAWLFFPDRWSSEPIIKVNNKQLQRALHVGPMASLNQFFTDNNEYKLQQYYNLMNSGGRQDAFFKAVLETDERVELIKMLQKGELLKLFPSKCNREIIWLSANSALPANYTRKKVEFIHSFFPIMNKYIIKKKYNDAILLINKLNKYQIDEGGETVLSDNKITAEIIYNKINISYLFIFNLTLGLIGYVLFIIMIIKNRDVKAKDISQPLHPDYTSAGYSYKLIKHLQIALFIALVLSFLFHTFFLGLRTYISGRLPFANGYEIMHFVAWTVMLFSLVFWRKFVLIISFGFLLSGLALMVSSWGQMNPQITPLMPVLLSPWLSLHVSLIIMSYAMFSFTVINAITAFILYRYKLKEEIECLTLVSRIILYPATFFLGLGIFIGAIWANQSWNSYWSWDPKEVWALISFMVYALGIHTGSIKKMNHPVFFHVFMFLSFLTILMTYFGVNYFLGGMHSYSG